MTLLPCRVLDIRFWNIDQLWAFWNFTWVDSILDSLILGLVSFTKNLGGICDVGN